MRFQCPVCKECYEMDDARKGEIFCCVECGRDFVLGAAKKSSVKYYVIFSILAAAVASAVAFGLYAGSSKPAAEPAAAALSEFDRAKELIDNNDAAGFAKYLKTIPIDCRNPEGTTLLMYCVKKRDLEKVQLISSLGADIALVDNEKFNAACYAVLSNDLRILEVLIAKGAKIDDWENPLIGLAAEKGHAEILNFLLSTDPNPKLREYGTQELAIFRAIHNHRTLCARMLFNRYDLDITFDKNGNTPLLAAIQAKNIELVRLLQDYGVDLNVKSKAGDTAFLIAVKANSPEMIAAFSGRTIDYNQTNSAGVTVSMLAAMNVNLEILEKSLNENNVNVRDQEGKTALFYGCLSGNQSVLDFILSKNPEVNSPDLKTSPLFAALQSRNSYAVEKLLAKVGLKLNQQDGDGNDFFMYAAMTGDRGIFNLLFNRMKNRQGFDLFRANSQGKNIYDIAVAANASAVVEVLKPEMEKEYYAREVKPVLDNLVKAGTIAECKRALTRLGEFTGPLVGDRAKEQIAAVRKRLEDSIKRMSSAEIQKAIDAAKEDKYYESAIAALQKAIEGYPEAANLSEAQTYLAELRSKLKVEAERQARIKARKEKVEAMSQGELKTEIQTFINAWLNDMKTGVDTSSYWKSPTSASTFFSLKAWEIITPASYRSSFNTVIVQVESSTKGGTPIRKNWEVAITRNDEMEWKIISVTE